MPHEDSAAVFMRLLSCPSQLPARPSSRSATMLVQDIPDFSIKYEDQVVDEATSLGNVTVTVVPVMRSEATAISP